MEFENLAKQYLTYLIKQECWDTMEVKGRSIEVSWPVSLTQEEKLNWQIFDQQLI